MRPLLLALLAGCTPYWQTDMPGYRVQRIDVEQRSDLSVCGQPQRKGTMLGCAVRLREGARTLVYVRPGLDDQAWACVLAHEARHAAGQAHDARQTYTVDCG